MLFWHSDELCIKSLNRYYEHSKQKKAPFECSVTPFSRFKILSGKLSNMRLKFKKIFFLNFKIQITRERLKLEKKFEDYSCSARRVLHEHVNFDPLILLRNGTGSKKPETVPFKEACKSMERPKHSSVVFPARGSPLPRDPTRTCHKN